MRSSQQPQCSTKTFVLPSHLYSGDRIKNERNVFGLMGNLVFSGWSSLWAYVHRRPDPGTVAPHLRHDIDRIVDQRIFEGVIRKISYPHRCASRGDDV